MLNNVTETREAMTAAVETADTAIVALVEAGRRLDARYSEYLANNNKEES